MARTIAEEERDAKLKFEFEKLINRPEEQQRIADFKKDVGSLIEKPSNHTTVAIEFESEEHVLKVCAHGDNTSSMTQLVMENICKTLVCALNRSESKKQSRRSGNKVNKTRRGRDGTVKVAQIDEQHQLDCLGQNEAKEQTKKQKIHLCKPWSRELCKFATSPKYNRMWDDSGSLRVDHLMKPKMVLLLKVFNVEGRTKISKGTKEVVAAALQNLNISQSSI